MGNIEEGNIEEDKTKTVISMYDVRGIQKYIYRTPKVRNAIGASYIVEHIIEDALKYAIESIKNEQTDGAGNKNPYVNIKVKLEWYDKGKEKDCICGYNEENNDVEVLFIGGGNAFVSYSSIDLCRNINQRMSKYTLVNSYSFQLAVAIHEKSDNYSNDYKSLQEKMADTKADMAVAKPLGALPVMKTELKSGYPAVFIDKGDEIFRLTNEKKNEPKSYETVLKLRAYIKKKKEKRLEKEETVFDNLVLKKGEDSQLAVVHIDGNNMGLRIRGLIENKENYNDAVKEMRKVSYQITSSFRKVFDEMHDYFTKAAKEEVAFSGKENKYFIREILVAGDDITYVCNAGIALETVEYYCRKISAYAMNGKTDKESIDNYGFSVCAGIAFIGSHFPFYIGYEVAESCCSIAKERAKKEEYMDNGRIGNFLDFHICKNIQAQDLKETRKREYITRSGENLLIRPYYIHTEACNGNSNFEKNNKEYFSFENLKHNIKYFQLKDNIPHSFAKQLRNTYPQGQSQTEMFNSFLLSRGFKMPDEYVKENEDSKKEESRLYFDSGKDRVKTAKWYDALELMDYYKSIKTEKGGLADGEVPDKNRASK